MNDTAKAMDDWIRRAAGRLPAEAAAPEQEQPQPPDDAAKEQPETEDINSWLRRRLGR